MKKHIIVGDKIIYLHFIDDNFVDWFLKTILGRKMKKMMLKS